MEQTNQARPADMEKLLSLSVVVCVNRIESYSNLTDAVDSLLYQSHRVEEVMVVVDADHTLGDRIRSKYSHEDLVKVIVTPGNLSSNQARNLGARSAVGDIVAFVDDDAEADKEWAANIIDTYRRLDAVAVGGTVLPVWSCEKPDYLPEELYWLIGATDAGFIQQDMAEVRNTFGPNMSFRKDVFESVGYLSERLGFARKGTYYLQGDEAEFGLRMKSKTGRGVIFNPQAIVYHKVPASKLGLRQLLKRSLYQGYSKALLRKLVPSSESLGVEKSYLKYVALKRVPGRMKKMIVGDKPVAQIKQLLVLLLSVAAVGCGFVCGCTRATPS